MKFNLHTYYLVLVCLFGLMLLSTQEVYAQKRKDKKKKDKEVIENPIQKEPIDGQVPNSVKAELAFMEGMKEYIKNEYKRAIPYFEESLRYKTENAAAYYQLALCYFRLNRLEEALMHAMKTVKLDGDNYYYLTLQAHIERDMRMLDSAEDTYKKIINLPTTFDETPFLDLAALYIEMNEYKKAIQTYDKMEKALGMNQTVVRQKQILYLQINDVSSAILEGQKLINEFPDVVEFRTAQAELLINQKKYADAENVLKEVIKNEEHLPAQVHLLLAQIYFHQQKPQEELKHLKQAFTATDMPLDTKINLLISLYQKNSENRTQSLSLAKLLTEIHPSEAASYSIYGDFLFQEKQYQQSLDAYTEALHLNPNNYPLWERTIQTALEIEAHQKAIALSEEALEYFPNQPNLWFLNGIAYTSAQQNQEAIAALEQGKRMVANNPELVSQFESQLGDIYNKTKNYTKADAAYENSLTKNPNNTHALNNYAYYLSLRNENLDRAVQLGERLIKLAPNNSTYLDTFGWVLFVKGEYEKAHSYLSLAAKNTQSATIIEHYGDVLFKLGKKSEALEQWKKAQQLGTNTPELLQKINQGILPE